jgi:hypothetical protein
VQAGDLPDLATHKFCGSCQQWFTAEYGSLRAPAAGTLFTPAALARDLADAAAGDSGRRYFVCYNCQHRRKMRRVYLFAGLGTLVLAGLILRYLSGA